jgi:hypothetical protein
MRHAFLLFLCVLMLPPAQAAETQAILNAKSAESGLRWIKEYRNKPDPDSVPGLYKALSQRKAFSEPESSGVYVGFYAGVIGGNPKNAKRLLLETLPIPFEDQWLLIRAVAYSGHPRWRELMLDLITHFPDRRLLIEHYLSGKLPVLEETLLEPHRPTTMEKMRRIFKRETYFGGKKEKEEPVTFASHPELIDTHWGIYFATGRDAPIERIVTLLPWSVERDDLDKLTIGGMAKFTLAANAARDAKLLRTLKRIAPSQSEEIHPILQEVTEAAETADTGRIRKQAVALLDDLRTKGPGSKRDIAWWGQAGQTAISAGCIAAAVTGQVEFGIPCVVGGALSSAAIRYLASPDPG